MVQHGRLSFRVRGPAIAAAPPVSFLNIPRARVARPPSSTAPVTALYHRPSMLMRHLSFPPFSNHTSLLVQFKRFSRKLIFILFYSLIIVSFNWLLFKHLRNRNLVHYNIIFHILEQNKIISVYYEFVNYLQLKIFENFWDRRNIFLCKTLLARILINFKISKSGRKDWFFRQPIIVTFLNLNPNTLAGRSNRTRQKGIRATSGQHGSYYTTHETSFA